MTATISTLSSTANQDRSHAADIIRAAYRQVFGNRYLMELDVQPSIEALFINGDLTVQGLVTALAQSDTRIRALWRSAQQAPRQRPLLDPCQ